jgi:hypothetical protein
MRIELEAVLPLISRSKLQLSRAAPQMLCFCKMFVANDVRQCLVLLPLSSKLWVMQANVGMFAHGAVGAFARGMAKLAQKPDNCGLKFAI